MNGYSACLEIAIERAFLVKTKAEPRRGPINRIRDKGFCLKMPMAEQLIPGAVFKFDIRQWSC